MSNKNSYKKNVLLIIGNIPPPIGGVTIHVHRLLQFLEFCNYPYNFIDLRRSSYFKSLLIFFKSNWIHLHTSNTYFRFLFTLAGKLLNKKVILTIHGNLGRFGKTKNYIDNLSVRFATLPILINKQSLVRAKKINKNAVLITAFIPPLKETLLKNSIVESILKLKSKFNTIFCTNAYNLSFDKDGNEIYQITSLINIFELLKDRALIISDPSGQYKKFIEKKYANIKENIFFISEPHNFYEVLKLSDIFLRITSTDGDSLSVKEALFLGKNVIATNVVDRPNEVFTVENNFDAIQQIIANYIAVDREQVKLENGADLLMQLYQKELNK